MFSQTAFIVMLQINVWDWLTIYVHRYIFTGFHMIPFQMIKAIFYIW